MNEFVAGYQALTTSVVTVVQRLGLLSVPLILAVAVIVNYFGGEKAIRAVGIAFFTVMVLTILLNNAVAIGNWMQAPSAPAVQAAPAGMILFWG